MTDAPETQPLVGSDPAISAFTASGRDGNFDPDAIFMVLEARDLLALCEHVNRALDVAIAREGK